MITSYVTAFLQKGRLAASLHLDSEHSHFFSRPSAMSRPTDNWNRAGRISDPGPTGMLSGCRRGRRALWGCCGAVPGRGRCTLGGTSPLRLATAGIRITAARWPHSLVCTVTVISPTKSPCGAGAATAPASWSESVRRSVVPDAGELLRRGLRLPLTLAEVHDDMTATWRLRLRVVVVVEQRSAGRTRGWLARRAEGPPGAHIGRLRIGRCSYTSALTVGPRCGNCRQVVLAPTAQGARWSSAVRRRPACSSTRCRPDWISFRRCGRSRCRRPATPTTSSAAAPASKTTRAPAPARRGVTPRGEVVQPARQQPGGRMQHRAALFRHSGDYPGNGRRFGIGWVRGRLSACTASCQAYAG